MTDIADEIMTRMIALMKSDSNFTGLSYIKGEYPMVTHDRFPLCEIFIASEDTPQQLTGNYVDRAITGSIKFTARQADKLTWTADVATVPSYQTTRNLASDFIAFARKEANRTLNNLTLGNDGLVLSFSVSSPQYGYAIDERTNTFENISAINFEIIMREEIYT